MEDIYSLTLGFFQEFFSIFYSILFIENFGEDEYTGGDEKNKKKEADLEDMLVNLELIDAERLFSFISLFFLLFFLKNWFGHHSDWISQR